MGHQEAKCFIFKLGFKRKSSEVDRLQKYKHYPRIIPLLFLMWRCFTFATGLHDSCQRKRKAVTMRHGQVTWLQLVLSIFRLERDNKEGDCCQHAVFLTGYLLTLWQQRYAVRVYVVFLLWHYEK